MSWFRILLIVIGSFFMDASMLFSGCRLLNQKININAKNIIILFLFLVFTVINYILSDIIIRIIGFYIAITFCFKLLFNLKFSQCTFAAFITYLLVFISEIIFDVLLLGITAADNNLMLDKLNDYAFIVANFAISIITVIVVLIFGRKLSKLNSIVESRAKLSTNLTWLIIITIIATLFAKITVNNWSNDENFWLNMLLITGAVAVGFIVTKEFYDKKSLEEQYEAFVKYAANTENLLEDYRIAQHENINELLIIRSMVKKNNNLLLEYLQQILKSKNDINHKWINELKYLPFGGLKGILHYKITEMKNDNLIVMINISKEVQNSKLAKLGSDVNDYLCKIICVFLDNAREAAVNTERKRIFINSYCQTEKIIFEVANDFNDSINIQTLRVGGQSSKGKNRGYGLKLVKKIVETYDYFETETNIDNELFIQKVIIK